MGNIWEVQSKAHEVKFIQLAEYQIKIYRKKKYRQFYEIAEFLKSLAC